MKPRPPRLPKPVLNELEGLPWYWVHGSRHWRLMVDGRQVMVVSARFTKNEMGSTQIAVAHVRRFRRDHSSASPDHDRSGDTRTTSTSRREPQLSPC